MVPNVYGVMSFAERHPMYYLRMEKNIGLLISPTFEIPMLLFYSTYVIVAEGSRLSIENIHR
jgi:hypothetical protein